MIGDDIRFNENWSILVGLNRAETQTDSYDMSGTRTGGYDANEVTPSVSYNLEVLFYYLIERYLESLERVILLVFQYLVLENHQHLNLDI